MTYGVCKKRKYCNRRNKKKNSLLLTNVHVLYVLEDKTSKKNSVCPSVCRSVCLVFLAVDFRNCNYFDLFRPILFVFHQLNFDFSERHHTRKIKIQKIVT